MSAERRERQVLGAPVQKNFPASTRTPGKRALAQYRLPPVSFYRYRVSLYRYRYRASATMSDGNALVDWREACNSQGLGGLDDEEDNWRGRELREEQERKKRKAENQMKHARKKKEEKEAAEREVCILRETIAQVTQILSNALGEAIGPTGCTASLQGASGTSAGGPELGVVGRLAQRAADELVELRRTEPGLLAPPVPEPAPAPGAPVPVLGDWPIIVTVDLTEILKNIHSVLPLKELLKKERVGSLPLGKERKCVLDITSYNASNATVQKISTELKELLGISEDSSTRCTRAAEVLKINPTASIGVYMHGNLTKAHGHFMGVLNILLGGTKDWRFWKPGPKPNEAASADQKLTQQEGQLLWIPPGWYHEVLTRGTSQVDGAESRAVHAAGGVAHSFTCWHVPAELYLRMMASYASGQSEEAQGDGKKQGASLADKGLLYGIFVADPVRPVES